MRPCWNPQDTSNKRWPHSHSGCAKSPKASVMGKATGRSVPPSASPNKPPTPKLYKQTTLVVAVIFGVVTMIIWLMLGWRAMPAHERIIDTASEWMLQTRSDRMVIRQKTNQPRPQKKDLTIILEGSAEIGESRVNSFNHFFGSVWFVRFVVSYLFLKRKLAQIFLRQCWAHPISKKARMFEAIVQFQNGMSSSS